MLLKVRWENDHLLQLTITKVEFMGCAGSPRPTVTRTGCAMTADYCRYLLLGLTSNLPTDIMLCLSLQIMFGKYMIFDATSISRETRDTWALGWAYGDL